MGGRLWQHSPLRRQIQETGIKPVTKEQICGFYERITLAPALPQGITCSVPMKLAPDGYYENCSVQGKWEYTADHRGMITYGPLYGGGAGLLWLGCTAEV